MILNSIKKRKIVLSVIFFIFLFWSVFAIKVLAKPIPHTACEWHYIGDTIITDCGYKITDGCPKCGREIRIFEKENNNEK